MPTQTSKSTVLTDANSCSSTGHVCWVEISACSDEMIDNFHWSSGVVYAIVTNIDESAA
jgi:hypothetical protein